VRQPGTKHRLGPLRDPAVDDATLQAARELLVEVGYAGTTIDGVARRAGVGRPTIYRRWPSKAHLVHEAVFPPMELPEPGGDATLADEIVAIVRGAVEVFADPAVRAAVPGLMMEMRADPTLQEVLAERIERAARRQLREHTLRRAAERGEARLQVDPEVFFDALAGAIVFALCIRDEQDLDRLSASLTDLLLHGCADPAGALGSGREAEPPAGGPPHRP
jgi:AcrR family transcriptional regulator